MSFTSTYALLLAYAAYVVQLPEGTFQSGQARALRVAPIFVVPVLAIIMYKGLRALFKAMVRHTDSRIAKVNQRSEKIIHGLKDDMKFDRTEKLLRKYDPEYIAVPSKEDLKGNSGNPVDAQSDKQEEVPAKAVSGISSMSKRLMMSTVGGASMKLSGALAQLWTLTADTVVGDDPALLRSLKTAEINAQTLTEENARLRDKLERYENEFGILYEVGAEDGECSEEDDGSGERDGFLDGQSSDGNESVEQQVSER